MSSQAPASQSEQAMALWAGLQISTSVTVEEDVPPALKRLVCHNLGFGGRNHEHRFLHYSKRMLVSLSNLPRNTGQRTSKVRRMPDRSRHRENIVIDHAPSCLLPGFGKEFGSPENSWTGPCDCHLAVHILTLEGYENLYVTLIDFIQMPNDACPWQ